MVVYILWCSEVSLVEAHTKKNSGHVLFTTKRFATIFIRREKNEKRIQALLKREKKKSASAGVERRTETGQKTINNSP